MGDVDTRDVKSVADRWRAAEPDDDIRRELDELLTGDPAILAARFDGRLQFGTAGLRAEVGAGPLRMNRLVVRQAAAGVARYVRRCRVDRPSADEPVDEPVEGSSDASPGGAPAEVPSGPPSVVIGFDARRKSDVFADDTARVLAAHGVRAVVLPGPIPTPLLAWSITHLHADAGVMVTASHNPPADNGYKVFLGSGSQIVSPIDAEIAAYIDEFDPTAVPMAAVDDPLIDRLDASITERYLDDAARVRLRPDVHASIDVAYTPMHGVGGAMTLAAFEAAGLRRPIVVDEQFDPDPAFPTVAFPNPEEPGAMDRVIDLARSSGAALALANDPDADRLGVAIPQPDGSWRRLTGDEIGWLFADHILRNTSGDDRLVVTTLVSSSLLGKMAAAYGVHYAETFTGFKWIGRTVMERPDQRFVFGYEQALGYLVTQTPLDKDGITAAVMMAEIAAVARAEGTTLQARLDEIAARFGRHVIADASLRMDPADAARRVEELRANPPSELGGTPVESVESFPEANLLRLMLAGGVRVQVRPSGTEPKVKLYGEAIDSDPTPYLDALAGLFA